MAPGPCLSMPCTQQFPLMAACCEVSSVSCRPGQHPCSEALPTYCWEVSTLVAVGCVFRNGSEDLGRVSPRLEWDFLADVACRIPTEGCLAIVSLSSEVRGGLSQQHARGAGAGEPGAAHCPLLPVPVRRHFWSKCSTIWFSVHAGRPGDHSGANQQGVVSPHHSLFLLGGDT